MKLDAGTELGHHEIQSKIGEGGRGEVYLAQDLKLDRKVALKILPAAWRRQISTAGGRRPKWRAKEVFYLAPDNKLIAAEVNVASLGKDKLKLEL